jgi:hypothetical protein
VGYFTVPSVANYIMQVGGGGGSLASRTTTVFGNSISRVARSAGNRISGR